MTLRDYIKDVKKDWSDKEWLQHCSIQMHNHLIDEKEREYYKDKFTDLINNIVENTYKTLLYLFDHLKPLNNT